MTESDVVDFKSGSRIVNVAIEHVRAASHRRFSRGRLRTTWALLRLVWPSTYDMTRSTISGNGVRGRKPVSDSNLSTQGTRRNMSSKPGS